VDICFSIISVLPLSTYFFEHWYHKINTKSNNIHNNLSKTFLTPIFLFFLIARLSSTSVFINIFLQFFYLKLLHSSPKLPIFASQLGNKPTSNGV